jgi:hypothetical protein
MRFGEEEPPLHTTNYTGTFIAVADDCPAATGIVPPEKAQPTVARLQYDLIAAHPYRYTSDDVLFTVYATRNGIHPAEWGAARAAFFAKSQACLRASPLGKTYGWGIHFDAAGRVALYARDSPAYDSFQADSALAQLKAMKRAR